MTKPEDIGWGSYLNYEGPYYRGTQKFVLPSNPTREDCILAVITATEGGCWDALNMYDRCVCTSGLIQWCEAGMYGVSDMLGAVVDRDEGLFMDVFRDFMVIYDLLFLPMHNGRWRFHTGGLDEVNTLAEQQKLFLLRSDGTKGSWDEESVQYAKEFGATICTLWENPEAQQIQKEFTVARLGWFGMDLFRAVMDDAPKNKRVVDAFEAGYLSFAANNPRRADRALRSALAPGGACAPFMPWTESWLSAVMHELTFKSGVAIYPHRYSAIRPVINKLYQVQLGELSLEGWKKSRGIEIISVKELQMALEALGYDIGPSGADGVFGKKTQQAVLFFERQHNLSLVDGFPDIETIEELERELERHARQVVAG